MHRTRLIAALALTVACFGSTFSFAADLEWPTWRGPNRDAVSLETGLLTEWSQDGPPLLWQANGLGKGYSSVAISNGRIFTTGQIRDKSDRKRTQTVLMALDLADGAQLWTAPLDTDRKQPNAAPTIDGNRVYALGRVGDLVCVDAPTGKTLWKKNLTRDFGGKMMSGWGYSESPLVDGDLLICTPGAKDAMIVALDKKTGETVWKNIAPDDLGKRGRDGAGYSSIVISNAGGIKQYVQLTGRGVIGVAADDGRFLWNYNRVANGTANISTPIVKDDYVFASTGYNTGAALFELKRSGDGIEAEEKYFLGPKEMQNHHGGMVRIGDYIYCGHGHNQGYPLCIEMETGKVAWRPSEGAGENSAAVAYADGHLYYRYQDGIMALVQATPNAYNLKGSFKLATVNGRSWPHPVVLGGRLYIRDNDALLCYDVKQK